MQIEVTSGVLDTLEREACDAFPREACGLLLGRGVHIEGVRPARNVHPIPQTRFEIDPQTLIDAHRDARNGGQQIVGYYHSHPTGDPQPSPTDIQMAADDGMIWAIIGVSAGPCDPVIRFWRTVTSGFAPLSLLTVPR